MNSKDNTRRLWDFIIVGTGVGGATLGHALARAGRSVLFCEKGRSTLMNPDTVRGTYPELAAANHDANGTSEQEMLAQAGRSWQPIIDRSGRRDASFVPFIGCGTGGSSAISGMAMERMFPNDFQPGGRFGETNGSSLPDAWPFGYDELAPYYTQIEKLYHVRGTRDPLRPDEARGYLNPPPLTRANQAMFDFFVGKGMHPYRLPVAHDESHGCPGCQSYLSPNGCKHDSAKTCLLPALSHGDAALLDNCDVLSIVASGRRADTVVCRRNGEVMRLRGKTVVLAAGALASPAILLRSTSAEHSEGLGNSSGLVGRNLMRHYVDLFAVDVEETVDPVEAKEIAFNDLYDSDLGKLGTVQSFGALPPASMLAADLPKDLEYAGAPAFVSKMVRLARPLVERAVSRTFSGTVMLAAICEDLPYHDNRVELTSKGDADAEIAITYRVSNSEKKRIATFRRAVQDLLAPRKARILKQAENNKRIAHACGTLRAGDDPATSVLDRNNRAHDLDNLYAVDASFFPSSGGTNPSSTIAANALRVADHLISAA